VKTWEAALAGMTQDPEFRAGARRINMNVDFLDGAQTRAFVEREAADYTEMATAIGIRH